MPRVSVLMPARDAEATLPSALRTVLRQTEADWECVLAIPRTGDAATRSVAAAHARAEPRIRIVEHDADDVAGALNAGLAACHGDVVARFDADDLMHARRLELQLRALDEDPELTAVGARVRSFPTSELTDGRRRYDAWLNAIETPDDVRREVFVECPVAHPTLTIRRQALADLGYTERGWPEDFDLLLRLVVGRGAAVAVVPRRLVAWRDHPLRASRTRAAYSTASFLACRAHWLARGPLSGHQGYVLWGRGPTGRALERALAAHGRRPAFIVEVHPGRLGNTIAGAPVVPPEEIPRLPRLPIVVAVAFAENRAVIRAWLAGVDRDAVFAA